MDNPHTKPVRFWQDVIAAVTKKHPEILFLAEAFTRPGMMRALSYVSFTQSHCYFPWRNTKEELEEYLEETNGDGGFYQHNTFWPSTPDIMTAYLRDNGIAGHAVRAVLDSGAKPGDAVEVEIGGRVDVSAGDPVRIKGTLLGIAGAALFYQQVKLPAPNDEFTTATTNIYFRDGTTKLGDLSVQNRTPISYEEMP